jgi:hypothetical protein
LPAPTFSITRDPNTAGANSQGGVIGDQTAYTILCTANGPATDLQALFALMAQFPIGTNHPDGGDILLAANHRLGRVLSPNSSWEGIVQWAPAGAFSSAGSYSDTTSLLNLPVKVESIDQDFFQELSEFDRFGQPICNSAGDMYDPPGFIDRTREIVVLSKYKSSYVADTYSPFIGTLNQSDITIAGLGSCTKRTARLLTVKPAGAYSPYIDVTSSGSTGTFAAGDALTWGAGGTGTAVAFASGILRILNPSKAVATSDTINGPSGSVTAAAGRSLPPMKLLWVIERRKAGFDAPIPDKGTRGFWTDGATTAKGHIFTKKDHVEVSSPVLLKNGAPIVTGDFVANNPKFSAWASNNQLNVRIAAGQVIENSTGSTGIVLHTFQRIGQSDFTQLGL